ncbi:hypothetical protein ACMHYB_15470 [Sorangium sp. So ce1128]
MGLPGDAGAEPAHAVITGPVDLIADERWLDLDGAGGRLAEADSSARMIV